MAQTSALKSAQISALDTTQPAGDLASAGFGAPGNYRTVSGTLATVSADNTGSTYRMVRVPSTAVIKRVTFAAAAMTAGKVQLSVYYSSSTIDGTAVANQGLVVPTTGAAFFSDDIDCTSAVLTTDKTFANQASANAYQLSAVNKRLWDALGLATDPGGFFDIVAVCHTTAITTGAQMTVICDFVS